MSAETRTGVEQERDRVPAWGVYGFAVGLIGLLMAGALVTWLADRGASVQSGWRRGAAPVEDVPREIQGVDQMLFGAHQPASGDWSAKRRDLSAYHWVDRERGLVQIPIERAMDLVVERTRVE